jgi:DNA mismatch repair protein MutS
MEQTIEKNTPLMQQYFDIKAQHPNTLLLFQVGDFYELFFDDAKTAAAHLAIALTKRGKNKGEDVPLCGIPVHALNHYLTKLIKGGFRVALCEQLTKAQPGTMVERGVTRVFTPATLTDATMLDEKSASYLLSFFPGRHEWGLVFSELLTAQLFATTVPAQASRMVESELIRFFPDEIILPNTKDVLTFDGYFKKMGYYTSFVDPINTTDIAGPAIPSAWITQQFGNKAQPILTHHPVLQDNLQTLYWYLKRNNEKALDQFKSLQFYTPDDFVILDASTQKNLEIIKNNQDQSRKNTLLAILDQAKTPMGSRTIKKWLQRPLIQKTAITQRHEVVACLSQNLDTLQQLSRQLANIADLERIIGRIALRRALTNDYVALKESLKTMPYIKKLVQEKITTALGTMLHEQIADFTVLVEYLECSINDDANNQHIIKKGFDHQLDTLFDLLQNGQQKILSLEQKEIARTGISSLKIGYNQISGYYIEVTNPNIDKVPDDYQHQQTMANRKRFVTQELKDLERDLFRAQNELESIQANIFDRIKTEVETYLSPLRHLAQSLASIDALLGLATAAYEYRFTLPTFNDQHNIIINNGRHPVVEQSIGSSFVPNDTALTDTSSTWILTGPNMGGKSTYLRQVALTCIMAQSGSFVPADSANLPIIDRIFTRIGSGDNVAEGKSTFLVEMEETATICTMATKHSLVILDEVGRGTSTYDGMALAQAIIEHIHLTIGARCLFATHYHELTHLANTTAGIANYHTACKKINDAMIFLHKIIPGIAQGSFGIDVARLADIPENIIKRAANILISLQNQNTEHSKQKTIFAAMPRTLVQNEHQQIIDQQKQIIDTLKNTIYSQEQMLNKLKNLDCSSMTPKQALDFLWDLTQT